MDLIPIFVDKQDGIADRKATMKKKIDKNEIKQNFLLALAENNISTWLTNPPGLKPATIDV